MPVKENKGISLQEKSMNNFKPSHGSMPNSLKNASIKPSSQESEAAVSLSSSNSYVKKGSTAQQLMETAPVSSTLSSARKESSAVFPLSPAKAIQTYGKYMLDYEQGEILDF